MLRLDTFFLAALITSPAIKEAFIDGTMPIEAALTRYVIALVACMIGLGFLRSIYFNYASTAPRRRQSDRMPELPTPRAADPTDTLAPFDPADPSTDRRETPRD